MYQLALLFMLLLVYPSKIVKAEEFNLDALAEIKPAENPNAIIEEKISPIQDNEEKESPGIFDLLFGSLNKEYTDSETETNIDTVKKGTQQSEHFASGEFFNIALIKAIDRSIGKLYLLEIPINQPLDFEDLNIQVLSCWQPSGKVIVSESRALLDVQSRNILKQKKFVPNKIFHGWILASSPASSYVHHPKFDISLLECKNQVKAPEPITASSTKE
jgi:hypothetical protein